MKILVFGGTGEARELASKLVALGHDITSSLAGRTLEPMLPEGSVRIGGFGDVPRLRAYLQAEAFDYVVDGTHPFAEKMSASIMMVCDGIKLSLIHLCRPAWEKPEGAEWIEVHSIDQVYDLAPDDAVLLITTGHKALGVDAPKCKRVIRLIEPPNHDLRENDMIIIDRPPYTHDGEIALMRQHGVTHLVTKNSGGAQTRAKIDAAAELGIPVFMISRPALPAVAREVDTVEAAIGLLQEETS